MNRDEKPIMKSDVGEFAEGGGFEIYSNLTTGYEGSPCPHCKGGVCPLVVVAWNEGGHNLTEVCLECVKDALHLIDKQRVRDAIAKVEEEGVGADEHWFASLDELKKELGL